MTTSDTDLYIVDKFLSDFKKNIGHGLTLYPYECHELYLILNNIYAKELCTSIPFWSTKSCCSEYSERTNQIKKKFLYPDTDGDYFQPSGVRWNKIHGWKRRVLKTYIKNKKNKTIRQYKIWNKYVGRKDILYIHARIGGGNWSCYYDKVVNQPWFIEKVDDSFDCTYCDIYAKIEVKNK